MSSDSNDASRRSSSASFDDDDDDDERSIRPQSPICEINDISSDKTVAAHNGKPSDKFDRFIQTSKDIEEQLIHFQHAVQKLGSAFGLSMASHEVRTRLTEVRKFFEVEAPSAGTLLSDWDKNKSVDANTRPRRKRTQEDEPDNGEVRLPTTSYAYLSDTFHNLCQALDDFLRSIEAFEDYTDQDGYSSIRSFQIEIKRLLGSLELFEAGGNPTALAQYISANISTMSGHLVGMKAALKRFIKQGIPCISRAQQRSAELLLNTATIATFFAGVAASTAQSIEIASSNREIAISSLWFSSLVLSIASALTAMLALAWRQAVFSSPRRSLPWYIQFWVRQGYLVLLGSSVITFLAGLIIYTFDSQHPIVFWIVIFFTAFCGTGLTCVAAWFAMERMLFSSVRRERRRLLGTGNLTSSWRYWISYYFSILKRQQRLQPSSSGGVPIEARSVQSPQRRWTDSARTSSVAYKEQGKPLLRHAASVSFGVLSAEPLEHARGTEYERALGDLSPLFCVEQLKRMKHMQFSPDGEWLVVCARYDCSVYSAKTNPQHHQTLNHSLHARQAEWSPNGKRLVTRAKNAVVKLWSTDDDFAHGRTFKFRNKHDLSDIQWLNDDVFLVLAEDSSSIYRVTLSDERSELKLPTNLTINWMYPLGAFDIVLLVAEVEIENLPKGKGVKCIIVYKMNGEQSQIWKEEDVLGKVPLAQDIESLAFEPDGALLLFTYAGKAPEIWRIDTATGLVTFNTELKVPRRSNDSESVWGDGFFIGPGSRKTIVTCQEDDLVHFWDIEGDYEYLRSVPIRADASDELPVVSWKPNSRLPMMVSAGRNLPLRFWVPTKGINSIPQEAK